jgi:prevent-host-death family protein
MLVVEPPRKTVEEGPVGELSRDTAAVLARVRAGSRAVITKHGAPIAVLMEVDEAVGLCGTVLLSRREAEKRLFGDELAERLLRRELGRAPRILGGD